MLPQEIIRIKRDGGTLTAEQISEFIGGVTSGRVTEGQVAAFCMAVLWRHMNMPERVALTKAMALSGRVMEWKSLNLPGPVLDKHSTGGVGDKTSLVLGPLVAACGGFVPMIAGRGLGHTGGTIDKFDSIPGYNTQADHAAFSKVVKDVGCAIIGQTPDLAPADKRIYSIRDITSTVESLDLITASILSKKIAAGLDCLVMDVKFGTGAFMQDHAKAKELAESIASVATGAGVKTVALLTDMNQVLGRTAGNAVEVRECIEWLKGSKPEARLAEVTYALAADLLVLGGLAKDRADGVAKCEAAIANGAAAEKFARMVAGLGGPADILENHEKYLPRAKVQLAVEPAQPGVVAGMDVRAIGVAIVEMGGGRAAPGDAIDHAVGLTDFAQIGETIGSRKDGGRPLAVVHAQDEASAKVMATKLLAAVRLSPDYKITPILSEQIAAA